MVNMVQQHLVADVDILQSCAVNRLHGKLARTWLCIWLIHIPKYASVVQCWLNQELTESPSTYYNYAVEDIAIKHVVIISYIFLLVTGHTYISHFDPKLNHVCTLLGIWLIQNGVWDPLGDLGATMDHRLDMDCCAVTDLLFEFLADHFIWLYLTKQRALHKRQLPCQLNGFEFADVYTG